MNRHRQTIAAQFSATIAELANAKHGVSFPHELIGATEPGVPATEPTVAARMTGKLTPPSKAGGQ